MQHACRQLLLALCLVLAACSPPRGQFQTTFYHFGTLIDISLYDVDRATAQAAFDRLEADFNRWHRDWSPWEDGELARINRKLAAGESARPRPAMRAMLQQAIELGRQSQGLFNPAIGELIDLWRFHLADRQTLAPPAPEAIAQWLAHKPEIDDLEFDGDTLRSRNRHARLSLGAFAKGYGIGLALARLRAMGIDNAVINAGGDLGVSGRHGQRAWRIGIRHPRREGVIASVEAAPGESIFTSGDYERFYMYKGQRYHHILDPRTGYPARGFTSVTVIDPDPGRADAAATALLIAGPEQWLRVARAMHIQYVLLVDTGNRVIMNPKMAARVKLQKQGLAGTIISEAL